MSDQEEDLGKIWVALYEQCGRYRSACADRADATVLGSIASELRVTIARIDLWRAQEDARLGKVR